MRNKSPFTLMAILTTLLFSATWHSSRVTAQSEQPETPSDYVGSETCARCHANTNATFMETWHPNILRPFDEAIIMGDFTSRDPDLTFDLADVQWVLGGQYKQRYLTEIEGELYVLPAEWNVILSEWVAYEADDWRSRPYGDYCAGCHTTGYDPATRSWVEPGVQCEACHGPGADHVASTGNRTEIINPAELDHQDQVEVCAQCHSRGWSPLGEYPFPVGYHPGGPIKLSEAFILSTNPEDYWPDGTARRHHMQYQDWSQGVHGQSVNCIFCHTSHATGETDHQTRMVGNDRCLVCHEGNNDLAAHIPYMAAAVDQVNCTDCHMPQISRLVASDFQILSHTFRPPNPALSIAYGGFELMPNACNLCHEDESPDWAAAILGQEIPAQRATAVPLPTPQPIPTSITVDVINPTTMELAAPNPPSQPGWENLWYWGAGIAVLVLVGVLSAIWARRRGKTA